VPYQRLDAEEAAMARVEKLSEAEITDRLPQVSGWALIDNQLQRTFTFGNFVQAFGFMTSVALLAESMDHHPDWSNVYHRVTIGLNTHDVGGISQLDFDLAKKINDLVS
jgi:4a-hydroxytetrahydrobiopterin dehydratase